MHLQSAGTIPGPVGVVLRARLATAKVSAAKLQAALDAADADGRLRDQFAYHAAHTGRWSSRGVQLQNLPRPDRRLKDLGTLAGAAPDPALFRQLLPAGVDLATGVSALIRLCLRAAPG